MAILMIDWKSKMFKILLFSFMEGNIIAAQQIHGFISPQDNLTGGEPALIKNIKNINSIDNFKNQDFAFPKPKFIVDPILIHLSDQNSKNRIALARGIIELQSYNYANGIFEYKLTLDNLVFSQSKMVWNREKTDIPITGKIYFDVDNQYYSIITGKYDQSTNEISPIKSQNSIFFINKNLGPVIELIATNQERNIPVTITMES